MTNDDQSKLTRGIIDHIQDALSELGDMDIALDELGQQLKDAFGSGVEPIEQEEDATFQVGSRPTLSVSNISGRIHIQPGPDGTIRVHVVKRGSSKSAVRTRV
ncbi:MAG TPA: hypothetical protein VFA78_01455, partial [Chloroflexota bacterium]|nr:hypothetical protein [Chloroflexota bacterium]